MTTLSHTAPMGGGPGYAGGPGQAAGPLSPLRYAKYTDRIALFAWVVFSSVPSQGIASLIRYAIVGYFVLGIFIFSRTTLIGFVRNWPTMVIPLMCFVSIMWAPSASDAIRFGIFMFLTAVIPIYAGTRIKGKDILVCYFLGEIYGAILTILHPNPESGNWTGPFGQKNFLAAHMFIMFASGLPLILDPKANKILRLLAAGFVPLGAFIIFMAHSATTLLLLVGCTGTLVMHVYLWQPASKIPMARTLILMLIAVVALIIATILFGFMQFDAESSLLGALGKDSTLTGRTFLWDIAHRVINQHPLTGVGAVGFWRPEHGAANEITRYFFYEQYVKFSFHNSYLENGVQFGYPGYYFTYFLAAWGVWAALRVWMRNQTLYNAVFMVLALMVVVRSNAEVDLATELIPTAILFFTGAVRRDPPVKEQPQYYAPEQAPPPGPGSRARMYPRPMPQAR